MGGDSSKIQLPTKGSDQDPADFFVKQIIQSETERAFVEELISDQRSSALSSANVNEDILEADLATTSTQRSWSDSYVSTHCPSAAFKRYRHSQPTMPTLQSENGKISLSEKTPKGTHHNNYPNPAKESVMESSKLSISQSQQKRSCLDKREQLYNRGEKLEGAAKRTSQTNVISQSLSGDTKALAAQQEKKSWWKI